MSNKFVKRKSAKECFDEVYNQDDDIRDSEEALFDALKSKSIKDLKETIEAFHSDYVRLKCKAYCIEHKLNPMFAEDMFLEYLKATDPEFEDWDDDNKEVLLDGKPTTMAEIKKKETEHSKLLDESEIPDEIKELVKHCHGMKIDEFYKKMDELCKKHGIDYSHPNRGNKELQ